MPRLKYEMDNQTGHIDLCSDCWPGHESFFYWFGVPQYNLVEHDPSDHDPYETLG